MPPEPVQHAGALNDASTSTSGGPARKRARTIPATKPVIRKRGRRLSLSRLTDMPLDVIFEILSHLHPGDLLNVARTTKLFYRLMIRQSSVTIWKAALRNVPGLPECPAGMTEMGFASLMFSNHCHICGKTGCNAIEWQFCARFCKSCREDRTIFFKLREVGHVVDHEYMLEILPSMVKGKDTFLRVDDIMDLNEKLEDIDRRHALDENAIERAVEDLVEGRLHKRDRRTDIARCKEWDEKRGRDRERQLDEMREQRRDAVWGKLTELGLGQERNLLRGYDREHLNRMEGMKEPTPFTQRGWDKVGQHIIVWVRNCRNSRIREERLKPYKEALDALLPHLNSFVRANPLEAIYPTAIDFFMSPQIRPIVEGLVQLGVDSLDTERFKELIPEVCRTHTDMVRAHVVKLLPPWLQNRQDDTSDPLESALVWFRCFDSSGLHPMNECHHTSIAYPRIIGHKHIHENVKTIFEPQNADDDLVNAVGWSWSLQSSRFSSQELSTNITFDHHLSFHAAQIVELCGLDPATALYSDMDSLDARVACVTCKQVMTWRKAVTHIVKPAHRLHRCSPGAWVLLNEEDIRQVKKAEDRYKPKVTTARFYCYFCRTFGGSWWSSGYKGLKGLKEHLSHSHNIVKLRPKLHVDYYFFLGEPKCDDELPDTLCYKNLGFKVSTPALVAEGW